MAKKDKGANPDSGSPKKARRGMSREQTVAAGKKGILKILSLSAVKLAARNNFEGVTGFGQGGSAITDAKGRKSAANKIQPKWSPKGSLWNLPEGSETISNLVSHAKAAAGDLTEKKYSGNVKSFLEALTQAGGERGSKGFRTDDLSDLAGML